MLSYLPKLLRYSAASVAGVITSQVVLLSLLALDRSAVQSNITAVTAGAVPNYLINRYWTWSKKDRNRFFGEILPFWGIAIAGLVLSTIAVDYVSDRGASDIQIAAASLGAFGLLWVLKFVILEKALFGRPAAPTMVRVEPSAEPSVDGPGTEGGGQAVAPRPAQVGDGDVDE